jgi:hypothetical protein
MSPRPNSEPSRGFTIVVLKGRGEQPRRFHVPRWAIGFLLGSWVVLMAGAAWLGYASRDDGAPRAPASLQGRVASTR